MAQVRVRDAPGPHPEAPKDYSKKSEESGGVINMTDSIFADMEKEIQVKQVEEMVLGNDLSCDLSDFRYGCTTRRASDDSSVDDGDYRFLLP